MALLKRLMRRRNGVPLSSRPPGDAAGDAAGDATGDADSEASPEEWERHLEGGSSGVACGVTRGGGTGRGVTSGGAGDGGRQLPRLKVVLMSATLDAGLYSTYFGGCPGE